MFQYKTIRLSFFLLFSFFFFLPLFSQISHGGKPLPLNAGALSRTATIAEIPFVEMPSISNEAAVWRSEQEKDNANFKSLEFAHKFHVNLTPENSGIRFIVNNMNVWRVGIRSKGAYSLNILFSEFTLPEGAKVFVYNSDQTEVLGSYTHENNSELNLLPVQPISGDEIIVEYQEPTDAPFKGEIAISDVNHDFVGILRATEPRDPEQTCHPELVCYPEDIEAGSGVVALIINGSTYCTGVLVNNTLSNSTPYLLTATHCLNRDYNPSFLANRRYDMVANTIVAFFGYDSPSCQKEIRGQVQMTMASTDSVLILETNDISLLKFKDIPPAEYQPYYLGWDISSSPQAPYHGIHHPNGGVKKVAIENDPVVTATFGNDSRYGMDSNAHWGVRAWDVAATEGGSSGSPLLDKNKRVIGTLTGGESMCSSPKGPDVYASLHKAWERENTLGNPNTLKDYLDPSDSGVTSFEGKMLYATAPITKSFNYLVTDTVAETYHESVPMFATNNQYGYSEFAEEFYADKRTELTGIFIASAVNKKSQDINVRIKIYADNNGKPGMLIHEQPLNYSFKYYQSGGFDQSARDMRHNVENYMRFLVPIDVNGSFYISYSDNSGIASGFSALNVSPRKKGSQGITSAWIKSAADGWIKSSESLEYPINTSLLISVQVVGEGIKLPEPEIKEPEIKAYHNKESGRIIIDSNRDLISWEIYNTAGIKLFEGYAENSITRTSIPDLGLNKGIYILKIKSEEKNENIKILIR